MTDSDAYALLSRALRTLTDDEQGVVMRSLLSRSMFPAPWPGIRQPAPPASVARTSEPAAEISMSKSFFREQDADKVGFLLRLPASTHQGLKTWADEHGHSMNVIVRGLVERFLDEQGVGR